MKSIVWLLFLILVLPSVGQAATLTMGSVEAEAGNTVTIPVTVDVPGDVAAAAFTVSYDGMTLTLTNVESTFFDTFTNQWEMLIPPPDPMPPSTVTVNGETYDQPLLYANKIDITLLAGVRVQAGATQTVMFSLTFTINPDAAAAVYPVSLSPTVLNSTVIGYDGAGEEVAPLVGLVEGQSDLALAYPALPVTFVDGTVTVSPVITDEDGDGIDDDWEYSYFPGDLTVLGADSDYDHDGYTDLQEYLNSLEGLDINNMVWDPKVHNAPGQNGYTRPDRSSFWILMMPAIQAGVQQNP